jgi:NitT/TauT family transport system substrate-binding protein
MKSILLAATMLFGLHAAASAEKLTIMVGGIEKQIYMPAMLAQQIGAYKEQGLDLTLLNEPAGVDAETALLANEVQGVVGFYDHTIDMQPKGKILVNIVQFSRAPGEVELVSTRIADKVKTFADLKGKSLGVTGLGSSTNFLTLAMAANAGLKPGEITSVAAGAGATFLTALQQGAIDGGMTTEPTISRALSTGVAKILIDMRTEAGTRAALGGGTYPAASLYVQESWLKTHRETAQKLANAYVKTLKYIADHSAAEITEVMPKDYYVSDKAAYIQALDQGKAMFTTDGVMPQGGPETVLKVLSAFKKELANGKIDLARTYTTEFVTNAKSGT